MTTNLDIDPKSDLDVGLGIGHARHWTGRDLTDDVDLDRVRSARERWQIAQENLFQVLPPGPRSAGARLNSAALPPDGNAVRELVAHAQGAYADYLVELRWLHSG